MGETMPPRPGNYFIYEGVWIRDAVQQLHRFGVVTRIDDSDITIQWYPNSVSHTSPRMFRHKLRRGHWEIDRGQTPYRQQEWVDHDRPEVPR